MCFHNLPFALNGCSRNVFFPSKYFKEAMVAVTTWKSSLQTKVMKGGIIPHKPNILLQDL